MEAKLIQPGTGPRRGMPRWLLGCLITAGVFFVLLVVAVVLIVQNIAAIGRSVGTSIVHAQLVTIIQQSALPADQKTRIVTRVDHLADDFKAGRIDGPHMQRIFEALIQSPLLPLAAVYGAQEKYIKPSALAPQEKAQGVQSLQRFARGVYEKKIPPKAIDEVIEPISYKDVAGHPKLKQQVTTQELKAFIAAAKARADDAQVPDEPYQINVADEIDKALDKAMSTGGPATMPADAPATAPDSTPASGGDAQ